MKFSLALLALGALVMPVFSSPLTQTLKFTPSMVEHAAMATQTHVVRQDAIMKLMVLHENIKEMDKYINATVADVSKSSSQAKKQHAEDVIGAHLREIINLLDNTLKSVSGDLSDLNKVDLKIVVVDLVREITHTLQGVLSTLGLTATLGPLVKQLLGTLTVLLSPILQVVDGLFHTVTELLQGVLGRDLGLKHFLDNLLTMLAELVANTI